MYDKDNSSEEVGIMKYVDRAEVFAEVVELEEMIEMIGILYEMQGVSKVGKNWSFDCFIIPDMVKDTATEHAKAVFNTLDIDGDGELTEEEFVKGFLKDLEKVEAPSPWDHHVYMG